MLLSNISFKNKIIISNTKSNDKGFCLGGDVKFCLINKIKNIIG